MSWKLKEKLRALVQQEEGAVIKPWGGKISVALVYPNYYHVGMANLGFQAVYRLINESPLAVCERVFLPDKDDVREYERSATPLMTLESQKALYQFDFIAFSLSFENDYPHLLTILELGGIPLRRRHRKENHPLVFAGGITTFLNPEPLAEFIDFFAVGEAEALVPDLLSLVAEARETGFNRRRFLGALGQQEGFYVPDCCTVTYRDDGTIAEFIPRKGFPSRIKRRWVAKVEQIPTQSVVTSPAIEFGSMFLIEIGRGCYYDCRFCATGWVYRPVRMRSLESLQAGIEEGLDRQAKIGLVGTAVGDHPDIERLCRLIVEEGGTLSVSSLRANRLKEDILNALKASGHQSVTIAPETGSERLRRMLKKRISDEEIITAAQMVAAHDIPHLRLYFLIGLPTETMEDIELIVSLTKRMQHAIVTVRKKHVLPGTLTLCISPFVPKPFTPLQWAPLEQVELLNAKIKHIRDGLKKERQIHVTADLPKWCYVQALLSRGDRRVSKILLAVHAEKGNWNKALKETDINPDFYVYRQRELTETFPWDFIDHGIDKEKLRAEYQRALTEA